LRVGGGPGVSFLTIHTRACLLALCVTGGMLLYQCDSGSSEDGHTDAARVPDTSDASHRETDSSTTEKCLGPDRWMSTSGPCEALDSEECSAEEPMCHPVFGKAVASACIQPSGYAGCRTAGELNASGEFEAFSCATVVTYARDLAGSVWVIFPDSCIPDGWCAIDGPPAFDIPRDECP